MITERELLSTHSILNEAVLRRWIELGWIFPSIDGQDISFDMIDVARVHLISELHFDLDIEEDTMTMVLSLLDQLYAVRRSLSAVMSAIATQPEDIRGRIATEVEARRGVFVAPRE
jgi:chaperone modulatory protein CbpM